MSFIRITSLISTYLVLLALIILFGGMSLAVVTRTAVMTHVFASSLFLLVLSVPATLLCLFACYKRRIITAGNLIFSLFFSITILAMGEIKTKSNTRVVITIAPVQSNIFPALTFTTFYLNQPKDTEKRGLAQRENRVE